MIHKKFLILILFPFFLFSQEENKIKVIDFVSGDYPIGEKVKIYFDKDWHPLTLVDSAAYYRIVKFKEQNIPSGKVLDYFITGEKQNSFYATYIGISKKGLDSVFSNGPSVRYFKNGNISSSTTYIENVRFGFENSYYESGNIESKIFE